MYIYIYIMPGFGIGLAVDPRAEESANQASVSLNVWEIPCGPSHSTPPR